MSEFVSIPKKGRGRPPKVERKIEEILREIDAESVARIPGGRKNDTYKVTVGGEATDKYKNSLTPPCKVKTGHMIGKGRKVKEDKLREVTHGKKIKPMKPPADLDLNPEKQEFGVELEKKLKPKPHFGGSSSGGWSSIDRHHNKENLGDISGDISGGDCKNKYCHELFHNPNGEILEIKPFPPKIKKIKLDVEAKLPPLPQESDLFLAPVSTRKCIAEECFHLLAWLDKQENHIVFDIDQVSAILNGDVKKLFLCCNVLESVLLMTKTGVNSYMWHGRERVERSLTWLRELAEKKKVLEQLYKICQSHSVETTQESQVKEKLSVGVVAQKLLMTFLVAPEPKTLTIGVACEVIYGRNGVRASTKSKVTDVSNILMGAGLLRRYCLKDIRKPQLRTAAFQYLGTKNVGVLDRDEVGMVCGGRDMRLE